MRFSRRHIPFQVTKWIQTHVQEMKSLLESGGAIRMCDPLFAAVFEVGL
jgi:hypothetical protein